MQNLNDEFLHGFYSSILYPIISTKQSAEIFFLPCASLKDCDDNKESRDSMSKVTCHSPQCLIKWSYTSVAYCGVYFIVLWLPRGFEKRRHCDFTEFFITPQFSLKEFSFYDLLRTGHRLTE